MSLQNFLRRYSIHDIISGDINPALSFKSFKSLTTSKPSLGESFSDIFKSFGNITNNSFWDINKFDEVTEKDIKFCKKLLSSHYDEIYYLQEGEVEAQSWFILAQTSNYYISLEVSAEHHGFGCSYTGHFSYSNEWKTLWTKYISNDFRNLVLTINNYGGYNFSDSFHANVEYLKRKLRSALITEDDERPKMTIQSKLALIAELQVKLDILAHTLRDEWCHEPLDEELP